MITFDTAVTLVRDEARPLGSERVALKGAYRRNLASPLIAAITAPPFDVSAMDGYAVREADLNLFPASFELVGESFAGAKHVGRIGAGEAVRIFTGAPVPEGADRVVIQENVRSHDARVTVDNHPGSARHIRRRGSDFKEGDELLAGDRRLDARALVLAAAADLAEIEVWQRPRVLVIGTGDELVAPGEARGSDGKIPESVSFGVAAMATEWGGEYLGACRRSDDLPALEQAASKALDQADLVVVTGGASVGEKDFAKAMFAPFGLDLLFAKVAIKPGKPVWLGCARGRLVMGLPGNPTSALVTARLLLAPLLAGLSGADPDSALRWRSLPLGGDIGPCGERETFVRARLHDDRAFPISNQDSSAQKALAAADLLIRRRPNAPAAKGGEMVEAIDF
jgi:molybdopterin molybdotransferase